MNIYIHELKMYRKTAIVWNLSLIGVFALFMAMFPTIFSDAMLMQDMLSNFPEEFLRVFGMGSMDFSSEMGYYSYIFTYILVAGSILAMNLGISVLSEEIRENTADFLLAKPIKRNKIVTAKILAVMTFIIITNIIQIPTARVILELVKKNSFDNKIFLMISMTLLFIQIFFVSFGLFLSVLFKKIKSVVPISLGSVFGFYIIQFLNESLDDEKLSYFTPFAYFNSNRIIDTGGYDIKHLILCAIWVVIFTTVAYIVYSKKDIPSI